jgi:galactofuranosylgalactofuranosylrhamnosyl-N-acetylglucosaminyl-diphospho-decaprenol beta-1,5/1,6-galactofuranosyltransferase
MMMQYYPVALRHRAIKDILSGPQHMRRTLPTSMPEARALAASFPETVVHKDSGVPLRARRGRLVFPLLRRHQFDSPTGWRLRLFTLRTIASQWMRGTVPADAPAEVEFSKADAHWWRVPTVHSAIVNAADGSGKNVYRHDRTKYRRMLVDSVRLHRRLRRQWDQLQKQYRAALPELTAAEAWHDTFGADR